MGEPLKPCPFCGSDAVKPRTFDVSCATCHATGPDAATIDAESVAAAWNRRAPLSPGIREALADAIDCLENSTKMGRYESADTLRSFLSVSTEDR